MQQMNETTDNNTLPRRHRSARWLAAAVVVVLMGIVLWISSSPVNREEPLDAAAVQGDIEEALRQADSLLLVVDLDHDTPDIAYAAARLAIARADSLAAAAGISAVDSLLRERADNSLIAARAALVAKADLFSDLPRLAADINVRLDNLDSLMSVFAIK